jgi:hypothetical protein
MEDICRIKDFCLRGAFWKFPEWLSILSFEIERVGEDKLSDVVSEIFVKF